MTIKQIASKYGNLTLTLVNTFGFISQFVILFTASATPLNAFLAILLGFAAVIGWVGIDYERATTKTLADVRVFNNKKQG